MKLSSNVVRGAVLGLIAAFSSVSSWAQVQPPTKAGTDAGTSKPIYASNVRLTAPVITLPLVLVKGYPFLEGNVNGVKGKLLLDTGEETALAINTDKVTPPNGVEVGRGMFGSGQSFPISRFPIVDTLTLPNGLSYQPVSIVRGQSGKLLERNITPDFLGWIGVDLFNGYLMKLDLQAPQVTFYKDDGRGSAMRAATSGEQVILTRHFDATARRNLPLLPITIGNTHWLAYLDTGSKVVLWGSPETRKQLEQDGSLSHEQHGETRLANLQIGDHDVVVIPDVTFIEGQAPISGLIKRPDANILSLGYEFLSQYKTVWDYQSSTLTLLRR